MSIGTGTAKINRTGSTPVASIHIGLLHHSVWRCDLSDKSGNSLHQWLDSHDSTFPVLDGPGQILDNREFLRWWITILKGTNDPDEKVFVQVDMNQDGKSCMSPIKVDEKFDKDKNVYIAVVEVTFE